MPSQATREITDEKEEKLSKNIRELIQKTLTAYSPPVEDFKQRVVALHDEHLEICCLAEALIQRMTLANDRQYQRAINLYGTIIKNENLIDKLNDLANRAVELDKNLSEAITRTNEAIELLAQLMDIESAYGNDEIVTFLRDQIDKFQKHPVKERVEGTLREIRGFRYRYWY